MCLCVFMCLCVVADSQHLHWPCQGSCVMQSVRVVWWSVVMQYVCLCLGCVKCVCVCVCVCVHAHTYV